MRSFLAQGLSERDLDDLVAFVRSFERRAQSAATAWRPDRRGIPPVIERDSPYGVEETVEKLKTAFNAANMRVVRVEYFGERFAERPEQVDTRRKFVDGCDFAFVNRALAIDPRIGLFLPCRVTVAEIDGKVKVMAMNPKYLSTLFNNHELDELCEKMSEVYLSVIEEATLWTCNGSFRRGASPSPSWRRRACSRRDTSCAPRSSSWEPLDGGERDLRDELAHARATKSSMAA